MVDQYSVRDSTLTSNSQSEPETQEVMSLTSLCLKPVSFYLIVH